MSRIVVVMLGLFFAVHVSIPALGLPAPVPVLLAFAAVIGVLCRLIWVASGLRIEWKAAT